MPRLMSVSHTEQAVVARTKTVTRRKGWLFLRPGDRLTLCRKVMGRKPGEPLVRLAEVEVVSVRREPLIFMVWCDNDDDCAREGFPGWTAVEFVRFFCDTFGGDEEQMVTRIEWRYLERTLWRLCEERTGNE